MALPLAGTLAPADCVWAASDCVWFEVVFEVGFLVIEEVFELLIRLNESLALTLENPLNPVV